jgi:YidC/Oxa1 family membrane protein insertase
MASLLGSIFAPLTSLISGELNLFHSLGAPWWLAIVLLTLSVRAALFPLTLQQVRGMRAMQELRPELENIRSRYRDDREKQQQKLAELYKERRINPLSGFLPLLIQMPVFITLYYTVRSFESHVPGFVHGGLLWFTDLSRSDPYFVLPALFAGIMLASQELVLRNAESRQRGFMRIMPLALAIFLSRFPAALLLYYVTSNSVTFLQNLMIYRRRETTEVPTAQNTRPQPGNSRRRSKKRKKKHR